MGTIAQLGLRGRLGRKTIKRGPGKRQVAGKDFCLADEARYIQRRAAEHAGCFVTIGPLALFSAETGDAWSCRSSGCPPRTGRRSGTHLPRGNRNQLRDRLERQLPHRRKRFRLHRSRLRPSDRHSRLPRRLDCEVGLNPTTLGTNLDLIECAKREKPHPTGIAWLREPALSSGRNKAPLPASTLYRFCSDCREPAACPRAPARVRIRDARSIAPGGRSTRRAGRWFARSPRP